MATTVTSAVNEHFIRHVARCQACAKGLGWTKGGSRGDPGGGAGVTCALGQPGQLSGTFSLEV